MKERERPGESLFDVEPKISLSILKSSKTATDKSDKSSRSKLRIEDVIPDRNPAIDDEVKSDLPAKSPPVDKREIYSFMPINAGALGRSEPLLINTIKKSLEIEEDDRDANPSLKTIKK